MIGTDGIKEVGAIYKRCGGYLQEATTNPDSFVLNGEIICVITCCSLSHCKCFLSIIQNKTFSFNRILCSCQLFQIEIKTHQTYNYSFCYFINSVPNVSRCENENKYGSITRFLIMYFTFV